MKWVWVGVLGLLVFLAVSSGVTKILLMPQDVVFFGQYGFSGIALVAFGLMQVIGGAMMLFFGTRLLGAIIVAITFGVSAVLLFIEGSTPTAFITLIALVLLGTIAVRTHRGGHIRITAEKT